MTSVVSPLKKKRLHQEFSILLQIRFAIGQENSHHYLNQSDAKPITTWSLAFSRALSNLVGFTLSPHWPLKVFSFHLIGRCDYFGFGFTTLNLKALSLFLISLSSITFHSPSVLSPPKLFDSISLYLPCFLQRQSNNITHIQRTHKLPQNRSVGLNFDQWCTFLEVLTHLLNTAWV